jgi:chemosensory pili system protein ChpA (sensor histidine kinase/response regulator)
MDMLEENLSQFSLLAAEALDELWGSLANPAEASDISDTQALSHHIALIQKIQEAASLSSMLGLQSVCALVEANLSVIQNEGRGLNVEEKRLFEEWPELLMGFMIGKGDVNAIDGMILNLESQTWSLPLTTDDGLEIREMLVNPQTADTISVLDPEPITRDPVATFQDPVFKQTDVLDVMTETDITLNTQEEFVIPPVISSPIDLPAVELQVVDSDMLAMLNKEFALMDEQMNEDLATTVSAHYTAQQRRVALANYLELIDRLGLASESVGLLALGKVFSSVKQLLGNINTDVSKAQQALLNQLPGRVSAYLTWPTDSSSCAALIDLLTDAAWSTPVSARDAAVWIKALASVEVQEGSDQKQARQTEAMIEDVTLAIPEDINAELLDGLLQELPLQTSAFTTAIERISAGEGGASDISRAMRAAHTLKGAANTVGVKGIANLTHHLEDILVALSEENVMPNSELATMLVNAGDCLEAMSETLMGVGPVPAQARDVLQEVLDFANRIDREGASIFASNEILQIQHDVEQNETGKKISTQNGTVSEHAQGLRVSAPVVDELLRLAGETLISNSQIQDRLRQTVKQAEAMQHQQQLVGQLVAELESLVDIRGIAAPQEKAREKDDFDPLEFDNFSELHTVTRRLIEASADSQHILSQVNEQFDTLSDLLEVQQRLQMENQHAVIRTRLVPVSSVVSRLQRSVRQTCRLLDKQVELVVTGETTNIDSNVLTDLMDPLMHILRNSVDHGIEDPATRGTVGKPVIGRIELSFAREGNSIVVRCKDDGVGLDYDAIRRIAENKGMIAPERNPTPEELARLILVNGFSTRNEATQVSGRGVGMDVVYNRVLQMKGTLALNSASGLGLTVELRLPATLLSAHSLIVRHSEKLIALSSRGVEDIHYVTTEQIEYIGDQPVYRVGNSVHNLIKLEDLLALPADRRESNRLGFPVLLTRMETGAINAILVQEVLDGRDVVLKNFGRYVPKIHGTIGAVILGDGSVAPVIDLVELLRIPVQHTLSDQTTSQLGEEDKRNELPDVRTALVVDDSLTARRAAAKVMKDAGYTVRTAIDGLEAVAILQNYVPDVMLVDMEMPRMNGLELTSHVRNAERTKETPVIMITSRSTEKHRQQAKSAGVDVYLTKPFSDEILLSHVARLSRK